MFSKTANPPHSNFPPRESSTRLMYASSSEHLTMCYDSGDMSGTDTTLQVNIPP